MKGCEVYFSATFSWTSPLSGRKAPSISQRRYQHCLKDSINPFAFRDFCRKTRFKASRAVFWSLSCYKELKPTTKLFTGRKLRDLLIHMQNISLRSSGMRIKQNFSSPLFSLFLPQIFSLSGYLLGFILVGKVLGKTFKILGLNERKGRWVVEQDFHGNFWVSVTWFFAFFSGVLD